jgi:hypothetical protein
MKGIAYDISHPGIGSLGFEWRLISVTAWEETAKRTCRLSQTQWALQCFSRTVESLPSWLQWVSKQGPLFAPRRKAIALDYLPYRGIEALGLKSFRE